MSHRELLRERGHSGKIQPTPLSSYYRLAWGQSCTSSLKTFAPQSCDCLFTCVSPEPDCKLHETRDGVPSQQHWRTG